MSDKLPDENQLYDLYDYIIQKQKELEALTLKSSPEGLDTTHEKEQLSLLKALVRRDIKELIKREITEGREPNPKSKQFRDE